MKIDTITSSLISMRAPLAWVVVKGVQIIIEENFPPLYLVQHNLFSWKYRTRVIYEHISWETRTTFYLLVWSNLHHIVLGIFLTLQQQAFQKLIWPLKAATICCIGLSPYLFKSSVFTLFRRMIADHLPNTLARIVIRCTSPLFPPIVVKTRSDCPRIHAQGYGMLVYNKDLKRTVVGIFPDIPPHYSGSPPPEAKHLMGQFFSQMQSLFKVSPVPTPTHVSPPDREEDSLD